jgi:hypothetical protein
MLIRRTLRHDRSQVAIHRLAPIHSTTRTNQESVIACELEE